METTSHALLVCTGGAVCVGYKDKAVDKFTAQDFNVCMSFFFFSRICPKTIEKPNMTLFKWLC